MLFIVFTIRFCKRIKVTILGLRTFTGDENISFGNPLFSHVPKIKSVSLIFVKLGHSLLRQRFEIGPRGSSTGDDRLLVDCDAS